MLGKVTVEVSFYFFSLFVRNPVSAESVSLLSSLLGHHRVHVCSLCETEIV